MTLRCPQCGFENGEQALYCAHCGTALRGAPAVAPDGSKEAVTRLRRYIPAVVADSALFDPERLRGERREVSILFADVVNFTQLSVSLDAEAVFNLLNGLLGRMVECIHRYDGMVDKFVGDGLMAVFGAPVAHENDPELAVRAALDMQRAAGPDPGWRATADSHRYQQRPGCSRRPWHGATSGLYGHRRSR